MAKVINLIFYARCPECQCGEFKLRLDGPGDNWTKILGTECANEDCKYVMDWFVVEKETKWKMKEFPDNGGD